MKLTVLAFGAHPDDTELGCSGTLAALTSQGYEAGVIDLTRGEMGSRGSTELRKKEAEAAAKIIGLKVRGNLGLPDTELLNNRDNQLPIIKMLRKYKPDICLLPPLVDRHPDHGDAARLIKDAIFYSGLVKIETKSKNGTIQEPHRPGQVLHYMIDTHFEPDFVFDISDTINIKEKAIHAFSSQFDVKDPGDEPQTHVSDPAFFEMLRARAKQFGHKGGFEYGEPFLISEKPFAAKSLDFLISS